MPPWHTSPKDCAGNPPKSPKSDSQCYTAPVSESDSVVKFVAAYGVQLLNLQHSVVGLSSILTAEVLDCTAAPVFPIEYPPKEGPHTAGGGNKRPAGANEIGLYVPEVPYSVTSLTELLMKDCSNRPLFWPGGHYPCMVCAHSLLSLFDSKCLCRM